MAEYDLEFVGAAALWNELLRPIFGGPVARDLPGASPQHPAPAALHVDARRAPPAPAPVAAAPAAPRRAESISVEQAFLELAESGGRRAEKDAVLLAVWQVGAGQRDVGFDAVARAVHAHDAFGDVRVKPHLLKHVNRSKMLELGAERETVRLNDKGRRYVRSLFE